VKTEKKVINLQLVVIFGDIGSLHRKSFHYWWLHSKHRNDRFPEVKNLIPSFQRKVLGMWVTQKWHYP